MGEITILNKVKGQMYHSVKGVKGIISGKSDFGGGKVDDRRTKH